MNRLKLSVVRCAVTAMLLGVSACGPKTLHDTFGRRYADVFSAQASDRAAQAPGGERGDEVRRIIAAYYGTLSPEGSSAAPATTSGGYSTPSSGIGSQGASGSSGGMDLRAR